MERNAVKKLISKPEPDHRLTVYSSLLYHRPSEIENIIPDTTDSCGLYISYVPSLSLEHPYDTLDVKWPPSNTHRRWQDRITQRWRWKHPPTDVLPLIFSLRSPVKSMYCTLNASIQGFVSWLCEQLWWFNVSVHYLKNRRWTVALTRKEKAQLSAHKEEEETLQPLQPFCSNGSDWSTFFSGSCFINERNYFSGQLMILSSCTFNEMRILNPLPNA